MRYSRLLILLGLVAAVGLSVALVTKASQSRSAEPVRAAAAGPPRSRAAAAAVPPRLKRAAQQALEQLIASRSRIVAPNLRHVVPLSPGGHTCFVGPGSCSETPCVVPVKSEPAPAATVGEAVATGATASAITVVPAPATAPGAVTVVPMRPTPVPGQTCPSRPTAPQTFRVSGP